MKRFAFASVMALAVSVTVPAMGDGPTPPPAPAKPTTPSAPAPAAPVVASPTPPKTPTATPAAPVAKDAKPAAESKEAVKDAPPPPAAEAPPAAAKEAAPAAKEPELPLRQNKSLALAAEPTPTPWPYKLLFALAVLGAGYVAWRKRRAITVLQKPTAVKIIAKTSTGLRGELALVEVGGMRLLVGITASSMQTLAVLPDEASEAVDQAIETDERPRARESEPPASAPSLRPAAREAAARATAAARTSTAMTTARDAARENQGLQLVSRARSLFAGIDAGPPVPTRAAKTSFAASRYADERDDVVGDAAPAAEPEAPAAGTPRRRARELPLEGQARGLALSLGKRK